MPIDKERIKTIKQHLYKINAAKMRWLHKKLNEEQTFMYKEIETQIIFYTNELKNLLVVYHKAEDKEPYVKIANNLFTKLEEFLQRVCKILN
ncbi:MAG: hypothetical protein ACYCPT_03930 [Acidimicrobiales bacterium]